MLPIKSIRPFAPTEPASSQFPVLEDKPVRVVHAIGDLTDSVRRFLIPAASALHRCGARQYVLILQGDGRREELERSMPPGTSITVIPEGAGLLQRSAEWLAAFKHIRALGTLDVVHLHGAIAMTLLTRAGGWRAARRLVYSPRGAWDLRPSPRWRARVSALLALPIRKMPHGLVLACHDSFRHDARRPVPERLAVLCPPLRQAFQLTRPLVPSAPIVLAAARGRSRPAATALAQLGVLAAHGTSDAPVFEWTGPCDAAAARILTAAGVRIHRDEDPRSRASRLSRAAAFVSPSVDEGYPWHIAEAMACGVPVVAIDTPANRHLVIHGVTGFLCRSVEEMLSPVITLIKRHEIRETLSEAARRHVQSEFGRPAFARRLIEAYGLPLAGLADAAVVAADLPSAARA